MQAQQAYASQSAEIGLDKQKQYAMMGFNEDYVLTMSGSRRNGSLHDHKDSDCNLVIWEEFDLALPKIAKRRTGQKNQEELFRWSEKLCASKAAARPR